MAAEAADLLEPFGYPVHRISAVRAVAGVPFGALLHLLPPVPPGAGDVELLQHAAAALRPAALVIDDAHQLDALSVTLVHQLAFAGAPLVLTVPDDVDDPVAELWRDGRMARIPLAPLADADADALIEALLAGPLHHHDAARVRARGRGLPRLLHEAVEIERAAGLHRSGPEAWRPWHRPRDRAHCTTAELRREHDRLTALFRAGAYTDLDDAATSTSEGRDAVVALHRGSAAAVRGRIGTSVRRFAEAVDALERHDPLGLRTTAAARLAVALAQLGRIDEAMDLTTSDSAPEPVRARAWVLGDADPLLTAADEVPDQLDRARLLHDAVRLGRAVDAVAGLDRLARTLDHPLIGPAAAHARGAAEQGGALCEQASVEFCRAGSPLLAADAAAHAAHAYRSAGDRRRSAAAAVRARDLVRSCGERDGVPRSPALDALTVPGITPRELDVATLAARGLTNQRIARELVLSVRTVETHLANCYAKLGLAGRDGLGAVLGG